MELRARIRKTNEGTDRRTGNICIAAYYDGRTVTTDSENKHEVDWRVTRKMSKSMRQTFDDANGSRRQRVV